MLLDFCCDSAVFFEGGGEKPIYPWQRLLLPRSKHTNI